MTNAKFRIKNGLELVETTVSGGTLTLVDGEIDSDQDLLLDAAGDIILDAAGNEVYLAKNGTNYGQFARSADALVMRGLVTDGEIIFKGDDGGVVTTLLTLDTANAGAATFNKGITLGGNITGPDNLDMVIAPQDENYIDIDGAFKVTPSQAPAVNRTYSTTGGSSGSRTTLTASTSAFSGFPQSGFVKIQGMSAGEQPYAYTRTSDTILTSTDSTFDDLTSVTGAITLVPQPIDINGAAAPAGNTGQFSHDGGQITLDGGKWGQAAGNTSPNHFLIGAMYGSVILQSGVSVKKLTAADNNSSIIYKPGIHGGPNNMIPILHVGGENQSMTAQEDYFTGQGTSIAGGSSSTPSETVYYNFKVAADALAMMKVKSKVANVADADGDSRVGTAIVSESASAGSMNGIYFNVDDTAYSPFQNHSNGGSIGAVDYNFGVGHLYNGSAGATQTFAMGYGSRSFNNGTSLVNSSFTTGSAVFGAQGNSLATQNTFFQANITGQVGIGPAQTPSSFATIHVGATGATNVGGVLHFDDGTADPSTTTGSLYSKNGSLYWGTTDLSASSASALNDLSDVTFSSVSTLSTLTIDSLNAFVFANDDDASISVTATTSTTAGKPLTISAGSSATGSNDVNGGDLVLASGGGDGTGTSSIQFKTKVSGTDAAAERMRIHTNGFVGIGTAAPTSQLSILSDAASASDSGATLLLATNDGATMGNGHRLGVIEFAGAEDGSGTLTVGARIEAVTEEAFDSSNNDTKLVFYTTTGNASQTAALTLTNAGNATVAGDLDIDGNDLTFGNGASIVNTDANTLTITEATTVFSGDIRLNGNDIKASDGTTAITLSGADVTIAGDLNITGDVNSVSVTNLDVDDLTITLAKGAVNSLAADGAGISIDGAGASLLYSDSGTKFVMNKPLNLSGTTESSSATTGELIVAGGAGIAKDLSVGDDLRLTSDASVFSMGEHGDITITHDNGTGGTLASAGAFIIDGEDDLTLDVGDGKDVLLLEAGAAYASIGQGSVDLANIADTAGATTIDTFDCSVYQATKYLVLVEDTTNNDFLSTEILVLGDDSPTNSAGYLTQYAVLYNDTELGTFSVTGTSSGNNINLQYDPSDTTGSAQHRVRVVATRIASI